MNRDTARAILMAAALMTVQALLLAALATSSAHAATVHRCAATPDSNAITYQATPCPGGTGSPLQVADARSAEQRSQARANHERQMDWLAQQNAQASKTSAAKSSTRRRHKRKGASSNAGAAAPVAVPLSSHRIGERPFERLGQQVSPPAKAHRHRRAPSEITARTPAKARTGASTDQKSVTPSP